MADVFVSYSRQDKALAATFVQLLEGYGWDVFWDQETRSGTLWPKVLEDELGLARCLLVLWTANSVKSRWVRIEAYEALQTDKLLPVRIEDVRPPMEFRQTQTFDLLGWNGDRADPRLDHLIADLCVLTKLSPRTGTIGPATLDVVRTLVPATTLPGTVESATQAGARQDNEAESNAESGAAVIGVDDGQRKPERRKRTSLGVGAAAVAVAVMWLAAHDPQPEIAKPASPDAQPVAGQTAAKPPVAVADPAPAAATATKASTVPVEPTATAGRTPAVNAPPASPPATVVRPSVAAAKTRVVQPSAASSRCLDIAERFQQTGQISAADRQFLSSKECAR